MFLLIASWMAVSTCRDGFIIKGGLLPEAAIVNKSGDMMKPGAKEIEAVSLLDGSKRCAYFIKKVADWEEVWGLCDDGWLMSGDDESDRAFPVWPAAAYASACVAQEWEKAKPKSISLDDFLEDVLPSLAEEGLLVSVFLVPAGGLVAANVSPSKLLKDLQQERALYE
ncbi:MAG: DUF2750 domain-containing protein [Deltaproteobacteria bacterium]|nr:DUF2750 domain-containing protein [Deltaproteobacteria bacterium]